MVSSSSLAMLAASQTGASLDAATPQIVYFNLFYFSNFINLMLQHETHVTVRVPAARLRVSGELTS